MQFRPRPKTAASFFDVLREVAPEVVVTEAAPAPVQESVPPVAPVEAVAPIVEARAPIKELRPEERDFVMGDDAMPSGAKARIEANLAAIRLTKKIAEEGRLASVEEKKVLAGFSGWGGCKEVLNDDASYYFQPDSPYQTNDFMKDRIPDDAKSWKRNYGRFYGEVKALLTETEWDAALASTLNAHYTDPAVARKMWKLVGQLGFRGGKILEPAFGANGVMIGTMPPELRVLSTVRGAELDDLSAQIAQQLYPQCKIENMPFQEALILRHSQDLVITNVPFSETPPSGQADAEVKLNLHNYFIAKSMEKLKPGGLAVIVTSASTLQNNREQRSVLSKQLQFLGALRLPSDAFKESANTDVVTDILVLRKPDRHAVVHEPFVEVMPTVLSPEGVYKAKTNPYGYAIDAEPVTHAQVNEYFYRHPEMVLGYHSMRGKMYGRSEEGQYTVSSPRGALPLTERMDEAFKLLPENVPNSSLSVLEGAAEEAEESEQLMALLDDKVGGLVYRDGEVRQVDAERKLIAPPWRRLVVTPGRDGEEEKLDRYKFPRGFDAERADALAVDYIKVREAYKKLIAVDLNPVAAESDSHAARAELNKGYDTFRRKWGAVRLTPAMETLLGEDPEFGAVCALENVKGDDKNRTAEKAAVFSERTLFPVAVPKSADTIQDAVMISLGQKGEVMPDYVAELTGRTEDVEGVKRLIRDSGLAFENPASGRWESRPQYLSGNVVAKLEVARAAIEGNPSLAGNVAALEAVQPKRVPFDQIVVQIGASWVPGDIMTRYAQEVLGQRYSFAVDYYPQLRKWLFKGDTYMSPEVSAGGFGTNKMDGMEIFEAALNQRDIRITWKDTEGKTHFDEAGSRLANQQKERIGERFLHWIKEQEGVRTQLEEKFNDDFNNMVVPEYKGDFLTFPGLSTGPDSFVPRDNQKDATARVLMDQSGLLAHRVGFGKTLSLILAAAESKRVGLAHKPMIVCYNSNYAQFVETIRRAYPQANLLVATSDSMNRRNRNTFLARVASGNWDMVVVAQSHFDLIPNKPETHAQFLQEEIAELKETLQAMQRNNEKHVHVRRTAKALESKEARLEDMLDKIEKRQDNCMFWEDLGVDLLLIDEIDAYKKAPFTTLRQGIKGIDTQASQRATGLLMKARHIQDRRNGRGVIGATGTPVSNTMAEAWNMIRLTQPNLIKEYNVATFDQFCSSFCVTVTALELNEANNRWKYETRLAKFINGPIFINLIRCGWDVKMDANALGLSLPKMHQEMRVVPLTDEVAGQLERLSDVYSAYESRSDKQEISWVPIMLLQVGKTLSVDPRLVDANARDNPGSVANRLVEEVYLLWVASRGTKATQAIFLDQYRTMDTSKLDEVSKGSMSKVEVEDADALVGKSEEEREQEADRADAAGVGEFNLYRELKQKLIGKGIPAAEIVIVNEVNDPAERKRVFDRLNAGELRIAIGSTRKLGTGNNFQERLIACHHFDPPRDMTPRSLEQRTGRMERPGNTNKEVYNLLWGMQDSVIPGVFQRILRKDTFIKQALSGKGVGMEFEDCGDVRLQEFTGMLISDKRVMQRAELNAGIKEEKMKRELNYDRARNVTNEVYNRQRRVESLESEQIPQALKMREWFASNVNVPPVMLAVAEVEAKGAEEQPVKVVVKFAGGTEKVFEGSYKDVSKELNKQVLDLWKKEGLPSGRTSVTLGTVNFNGLKMVVEKSINGIMDNSTALFARAMNPLKPGEILSQSRFGSVDALAKIVQVRHEEALGRPDYLNRELENAKTNMGKILVEKKNLPAFDETQLNKLEAALFKLEEDMRLNPVKRRVRGKKRETKEVVVEAESIRQCV